MDLREVGYDDIDWINLAQDRDQCRAYNQSDSLMAADGDCHHLCKLMAPVRHRWSINDVIGGIRNTCERPKTMFAKLEQRFWIKIEMSRGRSAQECFQGVREACGNAALPYRTVARWVKAFQEGLVGLVRIVAMDETWNRSYEPNLK
ncbi:hypothetical protein ANN_18021 [Periplaneta americana]|uniref:Mos1 transposase HTH domain-containing protein n=1 Tax=Periplaneta americana TaxID=6978 RepID=A0ABQ8SNR2_PERAM|nr:hypothetical protein ANN_18021 [Periplaneta americana]